jgi:hypothetical protein
MAREKWCCQAMQTAHAERRDRAIFVFADPRRDGDDEVRFWLASRAMTFDALAEDPPPVIPPHLALTVSTRKPIAFCPWCGVRLSRWYRRRHVQLLDPELTHEFGAPP